MAAILLIGYHGSMLMTLLSPPIAGRSMEVKLASQKWRQLQNKISQSIETSTKFINLDTALLGGVFDSSNNSLSEPPGVTLEENKTVQQTELDLPTLSGILRNTDIYGRAYATAVIDGQRLKENDRIQGFKIQEILEDGVVVTNSGKRWFLSVPDVTYSRVHASGVQNKDSK
jgi:hypothetical protein